MTKKAIDELSALVKKAQAGDREALEAVIRAIQDRVYHLSMRIMANPDNASEAAQEILILVMTKLSTFRGESLFTTWVYRVATNYLLTARRIARKEEGLTFELFEQDLEIGLENDPSPTPEDAVMLNQLRVSCTIAMLLCLDLKHRVAYVLGDILEFDQTEAADILGISKANYRKRLSRARSEVVSFTSRACGVVNRNAKCSCPRRLPEALRQGRVSQQDLLFEPDLAPGYQSVIDGVEGLEAEIATTRMQKATPHFEVPGDLARRITAIVDLPR